MDQASRREGETECLLSHGRVRSTALAGGPTMRKLETKVGFAHTASGSDGLPETTVRCQMHKVPPNFLYVPSAYIHAQGIPTTIAPSSFPFLSHLNTTRALHLLLRPPFRLHEGDRANGVLTNVGS